MLILGKSNDDKGTQLEKLTYSLLSALGYTNIVSNDIRSGGEEIDVRAELEVQGIGGLQKSRLICECKAYKRPADMNDWLKFLGKVFSEEKRQSLSTYGCFIALNGVNGNVAGHYDDIKSRAFITLVSGENLLRQVTEIYNICNLETVNNSIQRFTERQFRSAEVAYYENQVFWFVIFEKDTYTILQADGEPFGTNSVDIETLKIALELVLPAMYYVDLQEESEALRRAIRTKKIVISQLMIGNGRTSYSTLFSESSRFTQLEIRDAVKDCIERSWITQSHDSQELSLLNKESKNFYVILAEIYRFLLAGEMTEPVLKVLGNEYYKSRINIQMVLEIQKIQVNLNLTPEDIEKVVLLLKWSPTALAWALYPNEMLVNPRDLVNNLIRNSTELICRNYFLGGLYSLFKSDFRRPQLRAQFYQVHGLREIETLERVVIKSAEGVELQDDLNLRQAIIPLAEDYVDPDGSEWAMALALDSTPEPWEPSTHISNEEITSEEHSEL